jgi:hypothetical protein
VPPALSCSPEHPGAASPQAAARRRAAIDVINVDPSSAGVRIAGMRDGAHMV